MKRLMARFAALSFLLASCQDDPWTYRPRDGAVIDGPFADLGQVDAAGDAISDRVGTDAQIDVRDPSDATVDDATSSDVAQPDSSLADVSADAPDSGIPTPDAGSLTLRSAGIASLSGPEPSSGTLTLRETGFEFGGRSCTGTLCLTGGLSP